MLNTKNKKKIVRNPNNTPKNKQIQGKLNDFYFIIK